MQLAKERPEKSAHLRGNVHCEIIELWQVCILSAGLFCPATSPLPYFIHAKKRKKFHYGILEPVPYRYGGCPSSENEMMNTKVTQLSSQCVDETCPLHWKPKEIVEESKKPCRDSIWLD